MNEETNHDDVKQDVEAYTDEPEETSEVVFTQLLYKGQISGEEGINLLNLSPMWTDEEGVATPIDIEAINFHSNDNPEITFEIVSTHEETIDYNVHVKASQSFFGDITCSWLDKEATIYKIPYMREGDVDTLMVDSMQSNIEVTHQFLNADNHSEITCVLTPKNKNGEIITNEVLPHLVVLDSDGTTVESVIVEEEGNLKATFTLPKEGVIAFNLLAMENGYFSDEIEVFASNENTLKNPLESSLEKELIFLNEEDAKLTVITQLINPHVDYASIYEVLVNGVKVEVEHSLNDDVLSSSTTDFGKGFGEVTIKDVTAPEDTPLSSATMRFRTWEKRPNAIDDSKTIASFVKPEMYIGEDARNDVKLEWFDAEGNPTTYFTTSDLKIVVNGEPVQSKEIIVEEGYTLIQVDITKEGENKVTISDQDFEVNDLTVNLIEKPAEPEPEPEPEPEKTISDIDVTESDLTLNKTEHDLNGGEKNVTVTILAKDSEGEAIRTLPSHYTVKVNDKEVALVGEPLEELSETPKIEFVLPDDLVVGQAGVSVLVADTDAQVGSSKNIEVIDTTVIKTALDVDTGQSLAIFNKEQIDVSHPEEIQVTLYPRDSDGAEIDTQPEDFVVKLDSGEALTITRSEKNGNDIVIVFTLPEDIETGVKVLHAEVKENQVVVGETHELKVIKTIDWTPIEPGIPVKTIEDIDLEKSTIGLNVDTFDVNNPVPVILSITPIASDDEAIEISADDVVVDVAGANATFTETSIVEGVLKLTLEMPEELGLGACVIRLTTSDANTELFESEIKVIKTIDWTPIEPGIPVKTIEDIDLDKSTIELNVLDYDINNPEDVLLTVNALDVDGEVIDVAMSDVVVNFDADGLVTEEVSNEAGKMVLKISLPEEPTLGIHDIKVVTATSGKTLLETTLRIKETIDWTPIEPGIPVKTIHDISPVLTEITYSLTEFDIKNPEPLVITIKPLAEDGELIDVNGDAFSVTVGDELGSIVSREQSVEEGVISITLTLNTEATLGNKDVIITAIEPDRTIGEAHGIKFKEVIPATPLEPSIPKKTIEDIDLEQSSFELNIDSYDINNPEAVTLVVAIKDEDGKAIEVESEELTVMLDGVTKLVTEVVSDEDGTHTFTLTMPEDMETGVKLVQVTATQSEALLFEKELKVIKTIDWTPIEPGIPVKTIEDADLEKSVFTLDPTEYDINNPVDVTVSIQPVDSEGEVIKVAATDINVLFGLTEVTFTEVSNVDGVLLVKLTMPEELTLGDNEVTVTTVGLGKVLYSDLLTVIKTIDWTPIEPGTPIKPVERIDVELSSVTFDALEYNVSKPKKIKAVLDIKDVKGEKLDVEAADFTFAIGDVPLDVEVVTGDEGLITVELDFSFQLVLGKVNLVTTVKETDVELDVTEFKIVDIIDQTPLEPSIPVEPEKPTETDVKPVVKDDSKLTPELALIKAMVEEDRKAMIEWVRHNFWDEQLVALFEANGGEEADVKPLQGEEGYEQGVGALFMSVFKSVTQTINGLEGTDAYLVTRVMLDKWDFYYNVNMLKFASDMVELVPNFKQRERLADIGLAMVKLWLDLVFVGTTESCPNMICTIVNNNRVAVQLLYA